MRLRQAKKIVKMGFHCGYRGKKSTLKKARTRVRKYLKDVYGVHWEVKTSWSVAYQLYYQMG